MAARVQFLFVITIAGALAMRPARVATQCGVERWPVKVMADSDVVRIDTLPVATSVTVLGDIARPTTRFPANHRVYSNELEVWRLRARVRQIIIESDHDWHLVLEDTEDSARTMIGEIPDSTCAEGSRYAARFAEARRQLRAIPRGAIIEFTGVGFFDFLHGQRGVAPNGFELHPILSIHLVATGQ